MPGNYVKVRDNNFGDLFANGELFGFLPIGPVAALVIGGIAFAVLWKKLGKRR